ncbi:MAG: substrate-binding domain-containing protein, partial [Mycobacteriales bacterium]
DIKLLDDQTAEWATDKALAVTKTWLTKYGDKINGIWAANDGMALGATEALRAAGKIGKVEVVGTDAAPDAVAHVQNGEQVATVAYDGYWQGGAGLAMGYQVLTGAIDIAKLEPAKREFYAKQTLVTKNNAANFTAEPDASKYAEEFKNPWSRLDSPITY